MSGCWEDRMLQQITLYFLHPASNKLNWKPESNQGYQSSSTKWNHAFTRWQENTFEFGQILNWNKSLCFPIFKKNLKKLHYHCKVWQSPNPIHLRKSTFWHNPFISILHTTIDIFSEELSDQRFYFDVFWIHNFLLVDRLKDFVQTLNIMRDQPFQQTATLYNNYNKQNNKKILSTTRPVHCYCLDKKNFLPINKKTLKFLSIIEYQLT